MFLLIKQQCICLVCSYILPLESLFRFLGEKVFHTHFTIMLSIFNGIRTWENWNSLKQSLETATFEIIITYSYIIISFFWFAEPARKLSSSIHVELKCRTTTYTATTTTTKYLVKSVTIILLHSKQVKEMLQHCLVFDSKTTTLPLTRHPYWMIDSDLAAPSIQPNKQTYTNQPFEPGQPAISKQATDRSL